MKTSRTIILFTIVACLALPGCGWINRFQRDGEIKLPGLAAPVKVMRDEKGMAYIYAKDLHDAVMAQGFVTAQDRLFNMELVRLMATGRISELAGEKGRSTDIRMRTIGFARNAARHEKILNTAAKEYLQAYLDGVNAYIRDHKDHPIEFRLAGIKPSPWTLTDALSVLYYMGWDSAGNLSTEIIAQMLIEKLGEEKVKELVPICINPDDPPQETALAFQPGRELAGLRISEDPKVLAFLERGPLHIGSNNWVTSPKLSAGGKPILANDTHNDARILPGLWHPVGIITPELRAVGVMVPGFPGIVVGRTSHFAVGVTNSYGDGQDLYVETVDPRNGNNYLEGDASIPFTVLEETLKIKDKGAPQGFREEKIRIRLTRRGPVISGVIPSLKTDKVVTVRWSPFETMEPTIGFDRLLMARSVEEIRKALGEVTAIMLNFVFADKDGNIAWQTSGRLPIRTRGDGTFPYVVKDGVDNWSGWIPYEKMPQTYNPERGWVGTTNHTTVKKDYPYYYSSHLSPSYRQRRLIQLLDAPGKKGADDHWQAQRDIKNPMAESIAPIMAKALASYEDTRDLAALLSKWDYRDDPEKPGPTVFHAVYENFALLTFQDELGKGLAETMLANWYFWGERLHRMVLEGKSPWFDNTETKDKKEGMSDLFHLAGLKAKEELGTSLGKVPADWIWGKVHRLELVSPIRREGMGKASLGSGSLPMGGSGETLYRGRYDFNKPFDVTVFSSVRMVADLADEDKVLAVLPGGVAGRLFDPHCKDQITPYMSGEKLHWWFSDKAIQEHCRNTLLLKP